MKKKAIELSALTGTELLLLVCGEDGIVDSWSTENFERVYNSRQGDALVRACLDAEEGDFNGSAQIEEALDNCIKAFL